MIIVPWFIGIVTEKNSLVAETMTKIWKLSSLTKFLFFTYFFIFQLCIALHGGREEFTVWKDFIS